MKRQSKQFNSNQQEIQERKLNFGGDSKLQNKLMKFSSNFIKTSKYNIVTFLPKSLMLQFKKYANWYFLFTAILQCFPDISTQTPVSAVAPLAFVILLSMLREGIEDVKRHQSDREMNSSSALIWRNNSWELMKWANVLVGDIILVKEEEIIAADAIILCSSLSTGQAFIETSSLDGEKNLKPRQSLSEIQNLIFDSMISAKQIIPPSISGSISCSMPNAQLHFFEGCIYLDQNDNESYNPRDVEMHAIQGLPQKKLQSNIKNFLLRGSRIKNLEWAVGLVVYTGRDTKIMKNADQGRNKLSSIDQKCNQYIILVMVFQLILCFGVSFLNLISCNDKFNLSSYLKSQTNCTAQFFLTYGQYFLLLNTMIPISLVVSLEFIKVGQAFYMEKDKELFSIFNKQPLKVFSCTMNEELGQIQHVFSDKTGTLTCNKMEFKMLICGQKIYGDYNKIAQNIDQEFERDQKTAQVANRARLPSFVDDKSGVEFCFKDRIIEHLLQNEQSKHNFKLEQPIQFVENSTVLYQIETHRQQAQELLLLLSSCHECVLQFNKETGKKSYQGPSPDEISLVDAASRVGFAFSGLDNNNMVIKVFGKEKRVELLHSFEFDSDRKRMSVIIRDGNLIKMYIKGADSAIKARLNTNVAQPYLQYIDNQLQQFSEKGLRTLCLAMKIISESEYAIIKNKIDAIIGVANQEKQLKAIAETIEKDLILLGATAVEDRLQDNVPAVLRDFLKANINVWMLTGDKLETAENIAKSCNLITPKMGVMYIKGTNTANNKIDTQLSALIQQLPSLQVSHKEGLALVVEAWVLAEDYRKMKFLQIVLETKSVICCRVTPKQKSEMVKLVKEKLNKITLAIGDGANDVNMIQEAHIGIGIYGNEGMRAVQASDYAIGQFQFLWKLVLYHGRLNYIRISECILYFFYKNFVFTFPQFFFAFFCKFSGQSIFDDWYSTFYNCIFTFWPVVIKSVYEEDVYYRKNKGECREEKEVSSKIGNEDNDIIQKFYPKLYYIGQSNRIFQFSRFTKWAFLGIVQGGMCFFLHILSFNEGIVESEGKTADIWMMSISLYTSIIILVNMKLALNTQMWTIWNWVAFILTSLGLYFGFIWVYNLWPQSLAYMTVNGLFQSSKFYFTVLLTVLACFSLDLVLLTAKNQKESLLNYFKKVSRKQREIELDRIEQLQDKLNKQLLDSNRRTTSQSQLDLHRDTIDLRYESPSMVNSLPQEEINQQPDESSNQIQEKQIMLNGHTNEYEETKPNSSSSYSVKKNGDHIELNDDGVYAQQKVLQFKIDFNNSHHGQSDIQNEDL